MRILTLVYSIGIGGTERAAVNYAIAYKLAGEESRVLVLGGGFERLAALQAANVQVDLMMLAQKKEILIEDIKNWQPDIIHIHQFSQEIAYYIRLFKNSNTKVVETNVFSRPRFEKGAELIDLSMQLSKWGYWKYKHLISKVKSLPQVAVVPYIVLTESFNTQNTSLGKSFRHKYGISDDAFVIGRIGQPHPSKWDRRIVDVIEIVFKQTMNTVFLLVGVPENIVSLIEKKFGTNNARIKIVQLIKEDAELSAFYHAIDCFAHISKIGESFGYVIAEAMLFRNPVVTMLTPFHDNAQFEMVVHNFGGKCATTIKEFAQFLIEFATNFNEVQTIKNNLAGFVENRFSPKIIVENQLLLYNKILSNTVIEQVNYDSLINEQFRLFRWRAVFLKPIFFLLHNYFIYRLIKLIKR